MRIVAGKFSRRRLATDEGQSIRPTSDRTRESLFNILAHYEPNFFVGKRVLDLFAGTGSLGLEALSRDAQAAVFVENSIEGRALIQKNIESFDLQGTTRILRRDATKLGPIEKIVPFDLIFADPPYAKGLGEQAFNAVVTGGWNNPGALFVLEESEHISVRLPENFLLKDERHYSSTIIRIFTLI